jgi:hypothetical protein
MSVNKAVVHLFIPQLFQPLELWKRDFKFEVEAPHLSQLLRQFDVDKNTPIQGLDANLFSAVGMMEGKHEAPVAHYRYQAQTNKISEKALLCADPVHLEVGMNDITLTQAIDDLSIDEAKEMVDELNQHFKQDGLTFIVGSNQHWYIALPQIEDMPSTTPLDDVLRKNIAKFQPQSKDKNPTMNWQVVQNESQMILHNCEVNQNRERAGLATVNSLWFWGGSQGGIGEKTKHDIEILYASERGKIHAKMIAKAANCSERKLPVNIADVEFTERKTMIILDQLFLPAVHDELDQFQTVLTALDEQIIKPLSYLWYAGKVDLCIDGCDGRFFQPKQFAAWKFWKNKPVFLSELSQQE